MKKLTQKELEKGFKKEFREYQLQYMKIKKKCPEGATLGGFLSGFIFGLRVAGYKRKDLDYILNIDYAGCGITIEEALKYLKK